MKLQIRKCASLDYKHIEFQTHMESSNTAFS